MGMSIFNVAENDKAQMTNQIQNLKSELIFKLRTLSLICHFDFVIFNLIKEGPLIRR